MQGIAQAPKCLHEYETGKHERRGLDYNHFPNARIWIPICPSCGWVDTEQIFEEAIEKASVFEILKIKFRNWRTK